MSILVLMNFLPLVHWCAPFHNTIFSSLQYQYSLIDRPCYRTDHQMTHISPFRIHLFSIVSCPPKPSLRPRHPQPNLRRSRSQWTKNMLQYLSVQRQRRIWGAPDGVIEPGIDDGLVGDPDASPRLYCSLKQQDQKISHFMISANFRDCAQVFLRAIQEPEDHISVHTWTHPYMTTLTNGEVVAEIGWTLQIIRDSTGGRVLRYWRPPGDADNRVRATAPEVFSLTPMIGIAIRQTGAWPPMAPRLRRFQTNSWSDSPALVRPVSSLLSTKSKVLTFRFSSMPSPSSASARNDCCIQCPAFRKLT